MSDFDDLMQEALDAGVSEDWVNRVRQVTSASPLRKERDALTAERDALKAEVDRYRPAAMQAVFDKAGVKTNPALLNLPDDLDVTDHTKVNEWAVANGLAEPLAQPGPNVSPEEEAAHAKLNGAATGAGTAAATSDKDRLLERTDPRKGITSDAFWAELTAAGVAE